MPKRIVTNPRVIYLEPPTEGLHPHQGRGWSPDNERYGGAGIAYIREDRVEKMIADQIIRNARAEAPNMLEALKNAKEFIQNGITFGYINMFEDSDAAWETLPMIKSAIAKAEGK